jgi:hypothetical protein
MRLQVIAVASMKIAVCWVVSSCGMVEDYRRFQGVCCFHHWGDEGLSSPPSTSETSVNLFHAARLNNPKDIRRYHLT